MKEQLRMHCLYWSFPAVEQLLLAPAWLVLLSGCGVSNPTATLLGFLGLSFLTTLTRRLMPRMHLLWPMLAMLLPAAAWLALRSRSPMPALLLVLPFGWAAMRMLKWTDLQTPDGAFHGFLMTGVITFGIALLVFPRATALQPLAWSLSLLGTIAFPAAFLLMNRTQVIQSVQMPTGTVRPPALFSSGNNRLASVFLTALFGISAVGFLADAARALFVLAGSLAGRLIAAFLRLLGQGAEEMQSAQDGSGMGGFPDAGSQEPGWLVKLLEKVMFAVVGAGLAAGLLWLVYRGVRRLIADRARIAERIRMALAGLLARLAEGFGEHREAETGFNDEVGTTRDKGQSMLRATMKWMAGTGIREPRWSSMHDDGERVRWLYRRLVRKARRAGLSEDPARTPGKTVEAAAALLLAASRSGARAGAASTGSTPLCRDGAASTGSAPLCTERTETDRFRETYESVRYGGAVPSAGTVESIRKWVDGERIP